LTTSATESKLRSLEEAAETIADGSTVAIGGLSMNSAPMAFVRALARRKVRDLTVVAIVHGMPIEWLVAAGCVRTVVSGLVSLEGFGLAPRFRAAVQAGQVEIEEYSEHTLICRLQAAAYRIPYMPTKAGLGTDMLALHPETTREEQDPASGERFVACTPLPVDVAIVHGEAADARGNVRVDPKLVWMDSELVKAAARTIVTVERIVPEASFRAAPHRTTYPRFTVATVVEAPWGAYPTSCFPRYSYDGDFFRSYAAAHSDPASAQSFWDERIAGPETHAAFLDANGGARTLLSIARRTM
jgi:glutaconate CoA-transferase, subunit A